MPTLHFDADLSEWLRAFGNVSAAIADASPAHERIGSLLLEEARGNIDSEGGASRWPELAGITLLNRKKRYPSAGTKMLYVTGALKNSLRKDVKRDLVDVGSSKSDVEYCRAQFYGATITGAHGTIKIPKRSPFNWRAGVMPRVGAIYIHHLFGRLR